MAYFTSFLVCTFAIITALVSSQRLLFQDSSSGGNFSYHNCNSSAVPLYVDFLNVIPDPIIFGNIIMVNLTMTLDRDAGSHDNSIEVDLSLRLKTKHGYTELCQIIGESYCHYNDVCLILENFMRGKLCPSKLIHNNCSCPFEKGRYDISQIPIPLHPLSFELRGVFVLTINLHEEGKILGCVEIQFCITNCKPLGYE